MRTRIRPSPKAVLALLAQRDAYRRVAAELGPALDATFLGGLAPAHRAQIALYDEVVGATAERIRKEARAAGIERGAR